MPKNTSYKLEFPAGFDERAVFEHEAKGWLPGVVVTAEGVRFELLFYDPVRLAQDVEEELRHAPFVFESNLVVIPSVTVENMARATEGIFAGESVSDLRRRMFSQAEDDERETHK